MPKSHKSFKIKLLKSLNNSNLKADIRLNTADDQLAKITVRKPSNALRKIHSLMNSYNEIIELYESNLNLSIKNKLASNYLIYFYHNIILGNLSKLKLIHLKYSWLNKEILASETESCIQNVKQYLKQYDSLVRSAAFEKEFSETTVTLPKKHKLLKDHLQYEPSLCIAAIAQLEEDLSTVIAEIELTHKERHQESRDDSDNTLPSTDSSSDEDNVPLSVLLKMNQSNKRKYDSKKTEEFPAKKIATFFDKVPSTSALKNSCMLKSLVPVASESTDLIIQKPEPNHFFSKQKQDDTLPFKALLHKIKECDDLEDADKWYLPKAISKAQHSLRIAMEINTHSEAKQFFELSINDMLKHISQRFKNDYDKIDSCRELLSTYHLLIFARRNIEWEQETDRLSSSENRSNLALK